MDRRREVKQKLNLFMVIIQFTVTLWFISEVFGTWMQTRVSGDCDNHSLSNRPECYTLILYESSTDQSLIIFFPFTYCCPEWWEIFSGSCDWHWAVHTAPAGTGRSGWSLQRSHHCHQRCPTQSFPTLTGSLLSPPLWRYRGWVWNHVNIFKPDVSLTYTYKK